MKVRTIRKKTLRKLRYNKTTTWLIAPILERAAKIKERNDRIRAQVDKMFPDMKGVYVRP